MEDSASRTGQVTVGVDVSDRYSRICVLDEGGEVREEGRLQTRPEAFEKRFRSFDPARIAIEVGTHSPWLSRLLEGLGHEVFVANPRQVHLIYKNDSKDDRVDAELLARLARVDPRLLKPIRHRGREAQRDLAALRARDTVVRFRTGLVTHVRGAVKAIGGRLPSCSTESFPRKVLEHIPKELKYAMAPILEVIQTTTAQIRIYDKQVEDKADKKYPETALLRQVAGVGPLTAVAYVLTIEEPSRFTKSRTVGAFLGLRPRRDESGDSKPQLRITKAGDSFLRRLLVGSAQYILGPHGPDSDLKRWGLALAERGGKNAKKRAVVAVARKLAVLLHRLWVTAEVYEPLRNTVLRGEVPTATMPAVQS